MSVLGLVMLAGLAAPVPARAIDFESSVLPILEANCFRCHRAAYEDERGRLRKPKGGLRLDGRAWIETGVDGEPVVVPGDPDESALWTLTALDEDDSDRMPKSGDGLTVREQELLRRWIADGAEFGDWVGAPREPAPAAADDGRELASRLREYVALGEGLAAPPESALATARAAGARVEPVVPGSPLLRVSFPEDGTRVGDEVEGVLRPIASHTAWLDLSRTGVGDDALRSVGRMPRLLRLELRGTHVTDRGLAHVKKARQLAELNLYGTGITDRGLLTLIGMEALRVVRVGGTKCTEEGVEGLRAERPGVRVVGDADFGD